MHPLRGLHDPLNSIDTRFLLGWIYSLFQSPLAFGTGGEEDQGLVRFMWTGFPIPTAKLHSNCIANVPMVRDSIDWSLSS